MKKPTHILAALAALFIATFSVYGQGVSIRSFQGLGTNTFLETPTNHNPTFTGIITSTNLGTAAHSNANAFDLAGAANTASNGVFSATFHNATNAIFLNASFGNDTNAGDFAHPVQTPAQAFVLAQVRFPSNGTVVATPGDSYSFHDLVVSNNSVLSLVAKDTTWTLDTNYLTGINLFSNVNLTVSGGNWNCGYQPAVAFDQRWITFYKSNSACGTVTVRDVPFAYGAYDMFYWDTRAESNRFNLVIQRSHFIGSFDLFNPKTGGDATNSTISCYDSVFEISSNSTAYYDMATTRIITGGPANYYFENCKLMCLSPNSSGAVDTTPIEATTGSSVTLVNCQLVATNALTNYVSPLVVGDHVTIVGQPTTADRISSPNPITWFGNVPTATNTASGDQLFHSDGNSAWWGNNGGGLTNLNGANIQAGTVPSSAFDSSVPPRQNYLHIVNTNNPGWIPYATGTNDAFGSPVSTNGPPLASIQDTNIVVSTNNWNWPGPTNNLDWARGTLQRYQPTSTAPLAITNFLNFPVGQAASVVFWVANTNTSALNVLLPSPCETTNSLGGLTVSVNASNRLQILFQVSPASTNALFSAQQLIK